MARAKEEASRSGLDSILDDGSRAGLPRAGWPGVEACLAAAAAAVLFFVQTPGTSDSEFVQVVAEPISADPGFRSLELTDRRPSGPAGQRDPLHRPVHRHQPLAFGPQARTPEGMNCEEPPMRTVCRLLVLVFCLMAPGAPERPGGGADDPFALLLFTPEEIMQHRRAIDLNDEQRDGITRLIEELQGDWWASSGDCWTKPRR